MDCSEDEGGMAGCSRGESGLKVRRGKARGGQFCGSWAAAAVADRSGAPSWRRHADS